MKLAILPPWFHPQTFNDWFTLILMTMLLAWVVWVFFNGGGPE